MLKGRKFTLISFMGMSSLTIIMTLTPFLFLPLWSSLANLSIENLPLGNEESNFVSVTIKIPSYGVTGKRNTKKNLKHTGNMFRNLKLVKSCLLILDVKPFIL